MHMVQAVVFDMDGVILNTEAICRRTWRLAGKKYGLTEAAAEKGFVATIGCNRTDTHEKLCDLYGADFPADDYMQQTSAFFHEIESAEGIPLMQGVRLALDYLKKEKYRVALASSTRRAVVERQLKTAGVFDYFETVTAGDDVVHSKPDPEIYLMACRSLGIAPGVCAAIEDSPNGIRSAYAAGLKCIMVPDQVQPDDEIRGMLWHLCSSLCEIPDVL